MGQDFIGVGSGKRGKNDREQKKSKKAQDFWTKKEKKPA